MQISHFIAYVQADDKQGRNMICIGVSGCLLGEEVRYDGRHKLDPLIAETLSPRFELVPVCPEVELGLGVPREPIQLEGDPKNPSLMAIESRKDLTDSMLAWCEPRFHSLENLAGFIFKSKSPSCGLHVPVWNRRCDVLVACPRGEPNDCKCDEDVASSKSKGLFARAFINRFPAVPVIEAEELHDPEWCENFVKRVLARAV